MARSPTGGLKRAMFIGCSHGHLANPILLQEALAFAEEFRPHHRVHLGDAFDMACFRSGASGSNDEGGNIDEDLHCGIKFVKEYRPTLFMFGNHEDRLVSLSNHPRDIIASAAKFALTNLEAVFDSIKCEMVHYGTIADLRSWRLFGDTAVGHGYLFGENCTRDTVEMLGYNVIHAHDHKAKIQPGRVSRGLMGYSVGTLAEIPAMSYAKARRATSAWSAGIVYGEFKEGMSRWHLKLLNGAPRAEIKAVV